MNETIAALVQNFDALQTVQLVFIFLFAAFVKGFLGIGLPTAAMAFLTLIMPPAEAIPLLWLSIVATNSLQFAHAPDKLVIVREYWLFAVAIMVSIFIASMFIAVYPPALLTVVIGVVMIVFSLNLLLGIKLRIGGARLASRVRHFVGCVGRHQFYLVAHRGHVPDGKGCVQREVYRRNWLSVFGRCLPAWCGTTSGRHSDFTSIDKVCIGTLCCACRLSNWRSVPRPSQSGAVSQSCADCLLQSR